MSPLHRRRLYRRLSRGKERPATHPRSLADKARDIRSELQVARQSLTAHLPARDPRVAQVLSEIHLNLFDPSLTAASVGVSSPAARLRFQRSTGFGVRAYIENSRLYASKRLLAIPDLEVYLIADAVGYDHYETYARAFKRRVRCSPSEFRARGRRDREAIGNRHGGTS